MNKQKYGVIKMKKANDEFAPGIKSKNEYGDFSDLSPSDRIKLIIQKHLARRAGKHYDIRLGNEDTGLVSFSTKKEPPIPRPEDKGVKRLLIQQPLHEFDYKDFEGEIESGYGAGKVEKVSEEDVLISEAGKDKLLFTTMGRYPERFVLIRPRQFMNKEWLLQNITPTEFPPPKRTYINIKSKDVEKEFNKITSSDTIEAKVDGALGIFKILKDKLEILSHRKSKRINRPIFYTEKFFGYFPKLTKKSDLFDDTIFLGEVYAVKQDEDGNEVPLSPNELSGILNSTLKNALDYIEDNNIKFKSYVFDVIRFRGKDIDWNKVPYSERLKMVQSLVNELNKNFDEKKFREPVFVFGKDKAKELWEKLKKDRKLYTDGIIIWPEYGKPKKLKFFDEVDVYIRDIIPEERTSEERKEMAGKILWSFTPDGEIVGAVGTGMDHRLKEDMLKNPEEYIGRVMRLKFLEKTKDGRLRNPVFISLHEEKTAGFEIKELKIKRWNLIDFKNLISNLKI